jgi:hypothetical protein
MSTRGDASPHCGPESSTIDGWAAKAVIQTSDRSPTTTLALINQRDAMTSFGGGLDACQRTAFNTAITDAMNGNVEQLARLALPANSQAAQQFKDVMSRLGYTVSVGHQQIGDHSIDSLSLWNQNGGMRLDLHGDQTAFTPNPKGYLLDATGGNARPASESMSDAHPNGLLHQVQLELSSTMFHAHLNK